MTTKLKIPVNRENLGQQIASSEGHVFRVNDTNYKVQSQSVHEFFYDVEETELLAEDMRKFFRNYRFNHFK